MDAFKDFLPKGKVVECFENLATLTVTELKRILQRYKEKTGGIKADLVLRAYAIFCRAKKSEEQTDELPYESFLYCNETISTTSLCTSRLNICRGHPIFAIRRYSLSCNFMSTWSSGRQSSNMFFKKALHTRS